MPKNPPTTLAALAVIAFQILCSSSPAKPARDPGSFLNFVIYQMPPEYFADIALDQRGAVLKALSTASGEGHLNYANHYMRWTSTAGRIKSSSRLWVKLLPRDDSRIWDPKTPYVFIHMSKASEQDPARAENRAIVLDWDDGKWKDITDKILPEAVDRSLSVRPVGSSPGIKVFETDGPRQVERRLFVWQGRAFVERPILRHDREYERPLDAGRLALMALTPEKDTRELTEAIIHAGLVKDDRFRDLLESEKLKAISPLPMALAFYRHALDRDPEAVDFIVRRVAEEGRGDTNSLWIMSYFDEWDKTIAAYDKYSGGDGAAGEASWLWMATRRALYPEKHAAWSAKREKEKE